MEKFAFNSIPDCICIYKISNTENEKVYIGSTTNLNSRIVQHRYDSINRSNNCPKLYNAIKELGSDKFIVEIIEKFDTIDIADLHNKEVEYMKKFNSIENGYNERQDINGKYITSITTSEKMSISGKQVWANGAHKDHAKKLSKFQYKVYDFYNNLLEEDITIGDITKKYEIASSNIFIKMKKDCIAKYGKYDETITIKTKHKNFYIERIYIGGTKRGNYKEKDKTPKLTFIFHD